MNDGEFDTVNFNGNVIATIGDFDVGDRITITGSTDLPPGSIYLIGDGGSGSVLLVQAVTTTPVTFAYTITGTNGDTSIQLFFSPSSGVATVTTSATCTSAGAASSGSASRAVTKGFLLSRINGILLNDAAATSLINRSATSGLTSVANAGNGATSMAGGTALFGSAMGLGASRFDDADARALGSGTIQFSQSLSQLRRQVLEAQMSKERMALGAAGGGSLPLPYEAASPWDIWVEGRYSAFDDDAGNLNRDGHVGVLYVGSDYRVTRDLIVGALVQFDWSRDESDVIASKVDGNGWMIGPYLSARVHENIYFDLRAAWGRSSNDLALGTTSGAFDTSRWLVKGTLAGNWVWDAWRFAPSAELAYVSESQDAFTNSAGAFVSGQEVSLGRLEFGPEVGYRHAHTVDTFVEPFVAIRGVWDFDNPNVAIIDGFVVGPGDFWGRLQGGLNVVTTSGWYARGLVSWDGIGSGDYSGYTLQGTVNVPLN